MQNPNVALVKEVLAANKGTGPIHPNIQPDIFNNSRIESHLVSSSQPTESSAILHDDLMWGLSQNSATFSEDAITTSESAAYPDLDCLLFWLYNDPCL
jgi:hypothetical protein